MALPKKQNPLFQRMASDGVLGRAMNDTLANFRRPTSQMTGPSIEEQNIAANQPNIFDQGVAPAKPQMGSLGVGASPLSVATGNILGGGVSRGETTAAQGATVPEQVAGVVSGLGEQAQVAAYQQRLMDAGINLNPQGQDPAAYQQSLTAAQGIYNNIFGAGLPAGGGNGFGVFGQPSTSYAPTGLRQQAIAAGGAPVWGQGDVLASARPNAQGGTAFSLMQASRVGGVPGMSPTPTNPIAPEAPNPFQRAAQPQQGQTAFQKNDQSFKARLVEEQQRRATAASLPKGFVVDPADPTKVMPMKGSLEELQYQKLQQEMALKDKEASQADAKIATGLAQSTEKANLVINTVNKALDKTGYFNQATGFIPFTPGADLTGLVDTIKANIGFAELNAMRQASPTGGALGQVAVRELEFLQAALGNLSIKQSPEQLRENLTGVTRHYNNWLKTTKGVNPDVPTLTPDKQARLAELRAKKAAREAKK